LVTARNFFVDRSRPEVLIRILLGYILALPVIVPLIAQSIGTLQPFTVSVTMQARLPGHLQVFYDDGRGFSEPRSAVVRLQVSEEPRQYTLDLPSGRYRAFRIDPRTLGGQYVIERVEILAPDGSTYISFPLLSLVPAGPTSVTERSATRLTVNAAPGPNDLQLLYVPDVPVTIPFQPFTPLALGLLARVMFLWLCGILVVWVGERATNRWLSTRMRTISTVAAWCLRAPRITVCVTAVLATLVATYPVLLFGRSLVSPNNHGLMLLYETPPFAPGSTDLLLEDIRGSDVGAALYQDIPHSNVQREALVHGEVPLWNRYNADGRPLWAQGLTYLADPLHWLTLVTPDPSLGWDLKFVIHRFVFSLGVGFAAKATAGGWLPGAIGAVAAAFGGIYAYRLNHPTILVLTYAPWALLAWFKLAAATDLRRQAFAAIQIALFSALILFASIPKDAAMTLVGVWSAGVLGLLLSRGSWRDCGRRLVGAALAAVATALITTPHWLPFLDTLKQSFTAYDTPLALFGGRPLAIGFFLSPLNPGPFEPGLHMLALVLAVSALAQPRRLIDRPLVLACGIVAGGLLAAGLGAVPASLIRAIPFVRNVHHLFDVFPTAALPPLLIFAASGADSLRAGSSRRALVVGLLTAILSWWLLANVRVMARDDGFEPWALALLVPIAVLLPGCFYIARQASQPVFAQLAAICAVLVLVLPGGLHGNSGLGALDALLVQPRPRALLDQNSPAIDALHRATTEPTRATGLNLTLFSGSEALYELEGIGGADPLDIRFHRELVDASGLTRIAVWLTYVPVADVVRLAPYLDLVNVGFFLADRTVMPSGFINVPVSGEDRVAVVRRPTAWPRAFFVDGIVTYTDVSSFLRSVAERRTPFAAVQSNDREAIEAIRGMLSPSNEVVPGRSYKLTPNTTRFVVSAPRAGLAVLTETFVEGDFQVTLNGRRASYFRVNHAFKAVAIPSAGEWEVMFEYRPKHWDLSLKMAGLGFLLLAGFGLWASKPRYVVDTGVSEKPAARASS
jgi:hypothetical protein